MPVFEYVLSTNLPPLPSPYTQVMCVCVPFCDPSVIFRPIGVSSRFFAMCRVSIYNTFCNFSPNSKIKR